MRRNALIAPYGPAKLIIPLKRRLLLPARAVRGTGNDCIPDPGQCPSPCKAENGAERNDAAP